MQVSWFTPDFLPYPGRLGLTNMPGGIGLFSNTSEDLDFLRENHVRFLVGIFEEKELQRLEPPERLSDRVSAVKNAGMEFAHLSVEDLCPPSLEQMSALLPQLQRHLRHGNNVVVHCGAGLGRAGTVAACLLVAEGMNAKDAIATVRWFRSGAIQSESQEVMIARFAKDERLCAFGVAKAEVIG